MILPWLQASRGEGHGAGNNDDETCGWDDQVARTSSGLFNREHRLNGRSSGAHGEGDQVMEQDCAPEGDAEAEEVLCVTVDGQGLNTDKLLTLRMVYDTTGTEVCPLPVCPPADASSNMRCTSPTMDPVNHQWPARLPE